MNGHAKKQYWFNVFTLSLMVVSIIVVVSPRAQGATLATDFNDPAFQQGRQLVDHELEQLRGKAVNSREILFFGVEMSTRWQTSTGEDLHARANLGIDLRGGQPSPQFSTHITATTHAEYAAYQQAMSDTAPVINTGGLNAEGVVQLVQAGGNFNSANNAFWVDVGHEVGRGNVQPANNKLTETTPGGAQVTIGKHSGGLGMSLSVPGAGVVSQEIRSRQGLHQTIQLTSDHQQISNMTRLNVQLGKSSSASINEDFKHVLNSVRALEHLQ